MQEILIELIKETVVKQEEQQKPVQFKLALDINNGQFDCIILSKELENKFNSDQFQETIFFYYDEKIEVFIFLGKFPFKDKKIFLIPNQTKLIVKYRSISKSIFSQLIEEQKANDKLYITTKKKKNQNFTQNAKRIKERTISDVLEKVALWRKLYTGLFQKFQKVLCRYYNENNQLIQLPLEASAKKVGISKKTLDDYLAQIRLGKKFGFNFNANYTEKIGTLRSYVRDNKALKKSIEKKEKAPSQQQSDNEQNIKN